MPGRTILARFRQGVILGIVLGLVVYLGYALWAGTDEVYDALASFRWWFLAPMLATSLLNYGLRFVRWEVYLRAIDVQVERKLSLQVFLAGLAMTVTPGKVGEFLKAYLLKKAAGVPVERTAPVVLVERLADLLSLVLLASFGVAAYGGRTGVVVLAASASGMAVLLVVLRSEALTSKAVALLGKLPLVGRVAARLDAAAASSRRLLGPRPLLAGLGLGAAAWLCECVGYWLAFRGFGVEDFQLDVGVFAYAFSTVLGVVSPGGLGPTDLGLIELARRFTPGLSQEIAAAASFLVRLCTLWFAVILGARALLGFRRYVDVDVEEARRER